MIFASWCREGSGRWKHGQVSDTQYVFALEPYTDGTPAPTVVTKEVDMAVAAHFLLAKA
jgi:hypothetical protein